MHCLGCICAYVDVPRFKIKGLTIFYYLSCFVGFIACHAGAPARWIGPGAFTFAEVVRLRNCQSVVNALAVDLLHRGQLCTRRGLRVVGVTDRRLRAGEMVDLDRQQRQAGALMIKQEALGLRSSFRLKIAKLEPNITPEIREIRF